MSLMLGSKVVTLNTLSEYIEKPVTLGNIQISPEPLNKEDGFYCLDGSVVDANDIPTFVENLNEKITCTEERWQDIASKNNGDCDKFGLTDKQLLDEGYFYIKFQLVGDEKLIEYGMGRDDNWEYKQYWSLDDGIVYAGPLYIDSDGNYTSKQLPIWKYPQSNVHNYDDAIKYYGEYCEEIESGMALLKPLNDTLPSPYVIPMKYIGGLYGHMFEYEIQNRNGSWEAQGSTPGVGSDFSYYRPSEIVSVRLPKITSPIKPITDLESLENLSDKEVNNPYYIKLS